MKEQEHEEVLWVNRMDNEGKLVDKEAQVTCGKDLNSKSSEIIDVNFDHFQNSIELYFGSTLTKDACDASYGIDSVQIYVL